MIAYRCYLQYFVWVPETLDVIFIRAAGTLLPEELEVHNTSLGVWVQAVHEVHASLHARPAIVAMLNTQTFFMSLSFA